LDCDFRKAQFNLFGVTPIFTEGARLVSYSALSLNEIEILCRKLIETQQISKRPKLFEKTLTEAFEKLGFCSIGKGGRDEPDIILSVQGRKVIVDAKSTKGGEISEAYVNFDALERYKEKYTADYVAVVAPSFSGIIKETAKKRNIILIETQAICKALREHMIFKYSPENILRILFERGMSILGPSDIESSMKGLEKLIQATQALFDVIKSGEIEYTVDDLYKGFKLFRHELKFEKNEIQQAIEFLSAPPLHIFDKKSDGGYALISSPDEILKKLGILYKAIYPMAESWEEIGETRKEPAVEVKASRGLEHVLNVVKLMDGGSSHSEAFKKRADEEHVQFSTVSAACSRVIGLKSVHEFIELAKKENRDRLISLLQERFPDYKNLIEREIGKKYSSAQK